MSNNKAQPNFLNAPNHQHNLQNNGVVMQTQPQLGNHQNQNQSLMPPFMPNMQPSINTPPPFMNAANHILPLQNNQLHLPHMGLTGPPHGQSHVGGLGHQNSLGNANYNPMFPGQGQVMQNAAQINLSQQILAQSILNLLQQPNMNMNIPNGQFCNPYPVQNMNQQLPMQMSNPSQVGPYGMHPGSQPMFGFPNQVPQAMMVPQNPIFSANPQMGLVPGNQVRPQNDPNEKNLVPPPANTNAFASSPFSSQQLQGNSSASLNPNSVRPYHTNNSQPSAFMKSHTQANPTSNIKNNVPNSNWKGSPSKNFKNKQNRREFQGGSSRFQKSKFLDINNGKRMTGFPKEHKGKGPNNGRAGHVGLNSKELKQETKRSFSVTYSEQEIQQWREARRKNHPSNIQKKQSEPLKDSKVIDREVLQKELREILAKQAELGIEVAEIPPYYLKGSENQGLESEGKNTFTDKRKFQNKFNKKSDRKGRFGKKQKFADKDFSESPSLNKRKPTLLHKLLSADIKRDKSHLFQVFRFMVMNSFFKHFPDKPLIYPSIFVKEIGSEGGEERHLHIGKDVVESGKEKTVEKIVNHNNVIEDEECDDDDENDHIVHSNPHKEPSSLVKRQCDNGEGIQESDEEEGEIVE